MARHASPSKPHARRALIALATVSAALGASAATASADSTAAVKVPLSPATAADALGKLDPQKSLQGPTGQVRSVTGSVQGLKRGALTRNTVGPTDNHIAGPLSGLAALSQESPVGSVPAALETAAMLLGGPRVV
ncbi:hypothetical protein [Streptomyces guryensis]|uniref:ATP-binding protein n=1 Tax=Streptomyces guryensis TaxID=2886947 RepID=A0A9Q3VMJ4_9ACTN|nr:hypothetical protein [Streptomyces guryensis]MCD9873545.1 hypothetical protein [Streptomyces guryensis]